MYNPYIAVFTALTNDQARRFYWDTAIEHTFLSVAVTAIAIHHTIEAGKTFRQFHDSHLVPVTLFILVGFRQFLSRLDHEEIEEYQTALPYWKPIALLRQSPFETRTVHKLTALPYWKPIALLPPAVEVERELVTPCSSGDADSGLPQRILITPPIDPIEISHPTACNPLVVTTSSCVDGMAAAFKAEPYAEQSFRELQALCKRRRLSAKGSRADLVSRLCKADIFNPDCPLAPREATVTYKGYSIS